MAKENTRPDTLPVLPVEEAAWVAGITPEALRHFLAAAELTEKEGGVALGDLLRTAFSLLSQREAQVEMMRLQLMASLHPERAPLAHLEEEPIAKGKTPLKGKTPAAKGKAVVAKTPAAKTPPRKETPSKRKKGK